VAICARMEWLPPSRMPLLQQVLGRRFRHRGRCDSGFMESSAPFSNTRYFFPCRPLEVSPIGLSWFFSARGGAVIKNEMVWVWAPAFAFALTMWLLQKRRSRNSATF
jgi:hypothetical protein